jgi:hypothetical protein
VGISLNILAPAKIRLDGKARRNAPRAALNAMHATCLMTPEVPGASRPVQRRFPRF